MVKKHQKHTRIHKHNSTKLVYYKDQYIIYVTIMELEHGDIL